MQPSATAAPRARSAAPYLQQDDGGGGGETAAAATTSPPPPSYRSPSTSPSRSRPLRSPAVASGPRPLPPVPSRAQSQPQQQQQQQQSEQCWICLSDSAGDGGGDEALWQHCKCTLVAHNSCLITWLATSTSGTSSAHCPVCATPYQITEDPPSPFLLGYRAVVKRAHKASLACAVFGAGLGAWAASSAYTMWAIRAWGGEWLASTLFLRDKWPLSYYRAVIPLLSFARKSKSLNRMALSVNLPLVPLTLILSRTPLADGLLPFLPVAVIFPPHSPSLSRPMVPAALSSLSFSYPPSPTLTLCLLPWLRLLYLRIRRAAFAAALGPRARYTGMAGLLAELADEGPVPRQRPAGGGDGRVGGGAQNGGVVHEPHGVEIVAEVAIEGGGGGDGGPQEQLPVENRFRIGLTRLTSLLVGALLFPALAGASGTFLYWLATRNGGLSKGQAILKRILGISALGVGVARNSKTSDSTLTGRWSWLLRAPFLLSSNASSSSNLQSITGAAAIGRTIDPVWIRSTIGGGLVLVLRDCLELLACVLEEKRRQSRRVLGKKVVVVAQQQRSSASSRASPSSPPPAASEVPRTSSGGVDATTGRRAVVHTML